MLDIDSKNRFTVRTADYVAGRPPYPGSVIDTLRDRLGFDPSWKVVDVGAGTGISCELFLNNGNSVTAIEPNDAMRAAADERLSGNEKYDSIVAPAEATLLPDASADLIVAAQAFHWFDHHAFSRECLRLLTPRGSVVLMWNLCEPNSSTAATAYDAVVRRHARDLNRVANKWREGDEAANAWFSPETFFTIDLENPQSYTADHLLMRMASSSYMPKRDDPDFEPLRADLQATFDAHAIGGRFVLPYVCRLFVGVPRRD